MIEIAAYRGWLGGHLAAAASLVEVALKDAKENLARNPLDVPTETAVFDLEQALKLIRKQESVVYPVDRKAAA